MWYKRQIIKTVLWAIICIAVILIVEAHNAKQRQPIPQEVLRMFGTEEDIRETEYLNAIAIVVLCAAGGITLALYIQSHVQKQYDKLHPKPPGYSDRDRLYNYRNGGEEAAYGFAYQVFSEDHEVIYEIRGISADKAPPVTGAGDERLAFYKEHKEKQHVIYLDYEKILPYTTSWEEANNILKADYTFLTTHSVRSAQRFTDPDKYDEYGMVGDDCVLFFTVLNGTVVVSEFFDREEFLASGGDGLHA